MILLSQAIVSLPVQCSLRSLVKLLKLLRQRLKTVKLGLRHLRQMLVSANVGEWYAMVSCFELFFFLHMYKKRVNMKIFLCTGSPLNPPTPVGTCRYDSSLGDHNGLRLYIFWNWLYCSFLSNACCYLYTSFWSLFRTSDKKFINLLKQAPDGILDLNNAAETLEVIDCFHFQLSSLFVHLVVGTHSQTFPTIQVQKRRIYDITNVLEGMVCTCTYLTWLNLSYWVNIKANCAEPFCWKCLVCWIVESDLIRATRLYVQ